MKRTVSAGLMLAFLLLVAGCAREDPVTPTACLEGRDVMLAALDAAPDQVLLADGETRISDCLIPAQEAGPLAESGKAMIESATELNEEARRDPGGQANIALGYLLGAAQLGAENTSGIHTDLIRRLEASVRFSPGGEPLSPAFEAALEDGVTAGRDRG